MAQTALAYLDVSASFGAVQATATGFDFNFVGVYRDTVSGKKEILSGIKVSTLDADNAAAINAKIKAGIQAFGVAYGFAAVTNVIVPAWNTL